jgi:hypothetical protein
MDKVGPAQAGDISECKNKAGRRTGPIAVLREPALVIARQNPPDVFFWRKRSPLQSGYYPSHLPE